MTPLPKRRHSKARSRIRRASLTTTLPTLVNCGNCSVRIIPHRVCPACGFYAGKQVFEKKETIKVSSNPKEEAAAPAQS